MHQTYTDDAGKKFTAIVTGNVLTMYVPREPEVVKMKIPPSAKSKIGCALRRTNFHAFTAAVDRIDRDSQRVLP